MLLNSPHLQNKIGKDLKSGMGLIEVIIASAIILSALVSIMAVYNSMASLSLRNTDSIQAAFLAEEGTEIVRILRDKAWSNIGSTTNYAIYSFAWNNASSTWVSTTTKISTDIYERTVIYTPVYRDASFNITVSTTSPAVLDLNSKKVSITVAWPTANGTSTKTIESYIFNTFAN